MLSPPFPCPKSSVSLSHLPFLCAYAGLRTVSHLSLELTVYLLTPLNTVFYGGGIDGKPHGPDGKPTSPFTLTYLLSYTEYIISRRAPSITWSVPFEIL